MGAEKMMMQRRIDALDQYAEGLRGSLIGCERENAQLKAELKAVRRERDAAIMDMRVVPICRICKHWAKKEASLEQMLEIPDVCIKCVTSRKRQFEWRGVQENGGAE